MFMKKKLNRKLVDAAIKDISQMNDKGDIIREIVVFLKKNTDCDAVGVRFKNKGDYPYYTTIGFSDAFVKKENSLCSRSEDNSKVIKNCLPMLECLCGMVLREDLDKRIDGFTEFGSFLSNDTSKLNLLDKSVISECAIRNQCHKFGYGSILLIPIPCDGDRIGLIQLNYNRKDAFEQDMVDNMEMMANEIGVIIKKNGIYKKLPDDDPKIVAKQNVYRTIVDLQNITKTILKEESDKKDDNNDNNDDKK